MNSVTWVPSKIRVGNKGAIRAATFPLANESAHIVDFLAGVPVLIFDKLAALAVGIYDALAQIGKFVWNYISKLTRGTRFGVGPVPTYGNRDNVVEALEDIFKTLGNFAAP